MRNRNKFILLVFIGILAMWACDSSRLLGDDSRTNTVSNTSTLTNDPLISNGSKVSVTSNQSNVIETRVGIVERKPLREGICSSGFSEIPNELRQVYEEQTKQLNDDGKLSKPNYPLKNEINYYGFIYPVSNPERLKNGETKCPDKPSTPEGIKFVEPQVNYLVRMHMSAVIHNEITVVALKSKIVKNAMTLNKIDLCVDIECGTKDPMGEEKSFDVITDGDLEYARIYSDTQLYISALNKIRSISQVGDTAHYLTDSEINQMLFEAGRIAIPKSKEISK